MSGEDFIDLTNSETDTECESLASSDLEARSQRPSPSSQSSESSNGRPPLVVRGTGVRAMPKYEENLYDTSTWRVEADAHAGGSKRVLLTHIPTGECYNVPKSRVNRAMVVLDPADAAAALLPVKPNCNCSRKCWCKFSLQDVLSMRRLLCQQESEKMVTLMLAGFVRAAFRVKDSLKVVSRATYNETSGGSDSEEAGCESDLKPETQGFFKVKHRYFAQYVKDDGQIEVCRSRFMSLFAISKDKLTGVNKIARRSPNAQYQEAEFDRKRKRTKYNQAVAFWAHFFDTLCSRPNNETRLFPVNKPMRTIYDAYFTPWWIKIYGATHGLDEKPSMRTWKRARNDKKFEDVKRRPKHFHAQCGLCFRLKMRALQGFTESDGKNKWLDKMRAHDDRVNRWRAHVEACTARSRHTPNDTIVLFFDDTSAAAFPHATNRGLKDLPTARLQLIPWIVKNFATGKDAYYYTVKGSYKKGGNRLCTQLYHILKAVKTGNHDCKHATKLFLFADNYGENKNNTLFAFLCDLLRHRWFISIYLEMGEVGHTHLGDDAQHCIQNRILGQYFCGCPVHWFANYPLAWREEHSRPTIHLLHVVYDFDEYYRPGLNRIGGFTNTSSDEAYVRGFEFYLEANNVPAIRVSSDPANGKPFLGENNQPGSYGYVVLRNPPRNDRPLRIMPVVDNVVPAKYLKQLEGKKMRDTMAAVGQTEALNYLIAAANAGKLPIAEVIEEREPPGESGRLVRLECGGVDVAVREVVADFDVDSFDYNAFWKAPVSGQAEGHAQPAVEVHKHLRIWLTYIQTHFAPDQMVEDDAHHPCVGYDNVPPRERPSYVGSAREQHDRREANDDDVHVSSDEESRPVRRRSLPADRRVATTEETREVRIVVGDGADGPELWFYVPHMRRDQSRRVRRGWWLHACEAADLHGHYYIGPLEYVQRNSNTIVEDVAVLQDFPFVRTVKLTKRGEEKPNTVYVRTARAFSDEDLAEARTAMRTEVSEVEAQPASDSPAAPPPAPRRRRAAPEAAPARRSGARRRLN